MSHTFNTISNFRKNSVLEEEIILWISSETGENVRVTSITPASSLQNCLRVSSYLNKR